MRGILFACLAGAFITLQGVANASISRDIGTWQAATVTQFTGFVAAFLLLKCLTRQSWDGLQRVKPLYLSGGALAAVIIYYNVQAIQMIGVTVTMAALLIAQLLVTYLVDSNGWFEVKKQPIRLPQFVGIGLMITGVILLSAGM